jgi:hypothetical protein
MGQLRNEDRDELLELVGQVRSHLELQRALGVTFVEDAPVAAAPVIVRTLETPSSPALKAKGKDPVPSLTGTKPEPVTGPASCCRRTA